MYNIHGQQISFQLVDIGAKDNYILPTLFLTFKRDSKPEANVAASDMVISNVFIRLFVIIDTYKPHVLIYDGPSTKLLYKWRKNDDSSIDFDIWIDDYILSEIESLRKGEDLNLLASIRFLACKTEEPSILEDYGVSIPFNIKKSQWADNILPGLQKKAIPLRIPRIEFPESALTENILKFLNYAIRALNEGRYGDVLSECRKAFNALYNGIDEYGKSLSLSDEENTRIQATQGNDKTNAKRNVFFSRLSGHEEKGARINKLRNSIYYFLSLDPHESDYKDITFSREDGILAINITSNFIANMLHCIS